MTSGGLRLTSGLTYEVVPKKICWVCPWHPWLVSLLEQSPVGWSDRFLIGLAYLGDMELGIYKKNTFLHFKCGFICLRGTPNPEDCLSWNKHDLLWYIPGPPCGEQTVRILLLCSQTVTFYDLVLFSFPLSTVKSLWVMRNNILPKGTIYFP